MPRLIEKKPRVLLEPDGSRGGSGKPKRKSAEATRRERVGRLLEFIRGAKVHTVRPKQSFMPYGIGTQYAVRKGATLVNFAVTELGAVLYEDEKGWRNVAEQKITRQIKAFLESEENWETKL